MIKPTNFFFTLVPICSFPPTLTATAKPTLPFSVRQTARGIYLRSSDGTFVGRLWGQGGDIPTAADYDGDGKADIAVFRNGAWYYLRSTNGNFVGFNFGFGTDKPIPNSYIIP